MWQMRFLQRRGCRPWFMSKAASAAKVFKVFKVVKDFKVIKDLNYK